MSAAPKQKKSTKINRNKPKIGARPQEADDKREYGLWVNEAFLKRHQNRAPIITLGNQKQPVALNRYVELADIALGLNLKKAPKVKVPGYNAAPPPSDLETRKGALRVGRRAKPRTAGDG